MAYRINGKRFHFGFMARIYAVMTVRRQGRYGTQFGKDSKVDVEILGNGELVARADGTDDRGVDWRVMIDGSGVVVMFFDEKAGGWRETYSI